MGRHGGSGPRVRHWLATTVANTWPDALLTDTNSASHRQRNVKLLPPSMLWSVDPSQPRFGFVRPGGVPRATFCAAPFGRGNGWEGRSASALREGCIPLLIHPPGTAMALEPFVAWERFAVIHSDSTLGTTREARHAASQALHKRLSSIPAEQIDAMRCEMACAATHMTWGAGEPSASCALAAHDPKRTGVVATLVAILGNRARPPSQQHTPRPACPCSNASRDWHFFRRARM